MKHFTWLEVPDRIQWTVWTQVLRLHFGALVGALFLIVLFLVPTNFVVSKLDVPFWAHLLSGAFAFAACSLFLIDSLHQVFRLQIKQTRKSLMPIVGYRPWLPQTSRDLLRLDYLYNQASEVQKEIFESLIADADADLPRRFDHDPEQAPDLLKLLAISGLVQTTTIR